MNVGPYAKHMQYQGWVPKTDLKPYWGKPPYGVSERGEET